MSHPQKLFGEEVKSRSSFFPREVLISTFFTNNESKAKIFHHLLEAATEHSDRKRQRWIFCSSSDF